MNPYDAEFLEYSALDAACMMEAYQVFWPMVEEDFSQTYDMTLSLFEPLMFMQTRGILVDIEALEKTKGDILAAIAQRQEELNTLCGRPLNVNSSKDCQKYFYVELGIPPYYNEGSITVDDTALQRLARGTARRPGLRQAKLVQEIRGLQKLYSTYLNIEFDGDGRFRCSYNPRGTKFGRLSSSKTIFGTGTNAQNLPQEFKCFLRADPGYFLLEVDKRQAEWVVVAYLAQDANMLKVVESGEDPHVHTASLMFGLPPEMVVLENKLVGNNTDPDLIADLRSKHPDLVQVALRLPRTMSARQCGKKSNHGLNYDEGPNKFALINEMEQTEARRIVDLYHRIYPGIRATFHEGVKRQLKDNRTLVNCFGRRVRFLDAWGPDLWKAAYAMLPQSTVVDCINQGMVKSYYDRFLCRDLNFDLLAQVHDSLLFQAPTYLLKPSHYGTLIQARNRIYEYVSPECKYGGRTFRIENDMKIGLNWGGYNRESNPQGMREIKDQTDILAALEDLGVSRAE